MKIYIDESGIFSNPSGKKEVVSCVGGLVLPDRMRGQIVKGYKRLLKKWGVTGYKEIKGNMLTERMCNDVIVMLSSYEVMFTAVVVDCGYQSTEAVMEHKHAQGEKLIKCISKEFNNSLIESLYSACCQLEKMSAQLYLQSLCMTLLAHSIIQNATLYYAQNSPETLGNFSWNIDAKSEQITNYEKWWSTIVSSFLQSRSLTEPFIELEEGNYNAFERFNNKTGKVPDHLKTVFKGDAHNFMSSDIRKIMREDMNFSDSKEEYGLQLVDILTNCLGRSLRGNFGKDGWTNLPRILFKLLRKNGAAIPFVSLVEPPTEKRSYWDCIEYLDSQARSLV